MSRGPYFWKNVQGFLDQGMSLTDIASTHGSSFDVLWKRIKSNHKSNNTLLLEYLRRETDFCARRRLLTLWDKVLKSYKSKTKPSLETLAVTYGVKPSAIEAAFKASGDLADTNESLHVAMNDLLLGASQEFVINSLLYLE